jgi:hypothetical protein
VGPLGTDYLQTPIATTFNFFWPSPLLHANIQILALAASPSTKVPFFGTFHQFEAVIESPTNTNFHLWMASLDATSFQLQFEPKINF